MKDIKVLSIPNIITFIRIVLIPAFVTVLIYRMYNYALALFIIAGLSDALDGLLARATGQKTKLGAFLDPLADKFLLLTSFILFSVYGWIPKWLVITVISRDLIVTLGWFLVYLTSHNMRVQPTITGKAAIASQLILIAYILLSINFDGVPSPGNWMFLTVAALTIVSGLHYIYRGLKNT
jgi:cardiolipin synthase